MHAQPIHQMSSDRNLRERHPRRQQPHSTTSPAITIIVAIATTNPTPLRPSKPHCHHHGCHRNHIVSRPALMATATATAPQPTTTTRATTILTATTIRQHRHSSISNHDHCHRNHDSTSITATETTSPSPLLQSQPQSCHTSNDSNDDHDENDSSNDGGDMTIPQQQYHHQISKINHPSQQLHLHHQQHERP